MRKIKLSRLISGGFAIILLIILTLVGMTLRQLMIRHVWVSSQFNLLRQARSCISAADTHGDMQSGGVFNPRPPVHTEWMRSLTNLTAHDIAARLTAGGMPFRILNRQGQILQEHIRPTDTIPPPSDDMLRAAETKDFSHIPFPTAWVSDSGTRSFMCLLLPLDTSQGRIYLQLMSSRRFESNLLRELNKILMAAVILALIAGFAVSRITADWIAKPLERLARAADDIAGGDLGTRTGIKSHQAEISELAAAFDKMAEKLENSFDKQKRFVADASHELKTPLTAISGMCEILEDANEAEKSRALAIMNKEVDRMTSLVSDLLLLSKSDDGNLPHKTAEISLNTYLKDTASAVLAAHPNTHTEVTVNAPDASVQTAPDLLCRILTNIIENALKYAPDTNIEINAEIEDKHWRLTIRDHGPGVDENDLDKLFDRFYRADTSRTRKTGGSGLGLAIVKSLTENLGGTISLRNHPDGGLEAKIIFSISSET
ncbi:MAG: HAMP domain-containing histidine kinase [bacterium]|nr:HAMP domain-containing histidine kinase [bacterium]